MHSIEALEVARRDIQDSFDSARSKLERNRRGQFATPPELARSIMEYARRLLAESHQPIRFLDPAFGTGAFYSALLSSFEISKIKSARGYEIDPQLAQLSKELWADKPLNLQVADFTQVPPPAHDNASQANLLICNPPYVRHHHLAVDKKKQLQSLIKRRLGIKLSGLAGLYCHFLLLAHEWLAEGGVAGWLIPSEFMDVNYGKQVKQYLLQHVTLLHIHRFSSEDLQFADALVSSSIVWFKKKSPPQDHKVTFSFGGSLLAPTTSRLVPIALLKPSEKWTKLPKNISRARDKHGQGIYEHRPVLSDFFDIKRGIATGANEFFILPEDEIARRNLPFEFFTPILPSPRYLPTNEVCTDKDGLPIIEPQKFLLTCDLPRNILEAEYPSLWSYLQEGIQKGIKDRYLCRHRSPWYSQETRPAAPILCTYMGRLSSKKDRPFRFILNYSEATAPNVYLMLYPKPIIARALEANPDTLKAIWKTLSSIAPEVLMTAGRIYGGGLYKIEPKELAHIPADNVASILSKYARYSKQLVLF